MKAKKNIRSRAVAQTDPRGLKHGGKLSRATCRAAVSTVHSVPGVSDGGWLSRPAIGCTEPENGDAYLVYRISAPARAYRAPAPSSRGDLDGDGGSDFSCALDFLRAFVRLESIVMVFISVFTLENLEKIGLF